jgi:hypothetical protein
MQDMIGLRRAAAVGLLGVVAAACGSGGTSTPTSDGGNPASCPGAAPSTGDPCSSPGLKCSYGCNVAATCDGQHWGVSMLAIACAVDSGAIDTGALDSGGRGDGSTGCHSNADCRFGAECSPGGAPTGCGACAAPQNPCNTDSDCAIIGDAAPAQPMVCGPGGPCTCPVNGKAGSCIAACQGASSCGPDEACSATGLCVAKPCTTDADCPSTPTARYGCSAGTCEFKPCQTDADCSGLYCINGNCDPEQGACVLPPG